MRKVNLLRCDVARDASMQDLFSELSDTRVALSQAYARFNAVCAPELVDACVYEINAELSRYDYLLRQIKERSGEAVYQNVQRGGRKMGITEKILLVLFAVFALARGAQAVRRAVEARGQAARQHAARLCAARHSKRARRARQAFAGAESFQRSRHRRPRRAGPRTADLAEAGVYLMYIGQKPRRVFTREGYAASVEQQSC